MALSILDGNQSATTLSTILSSGQHITAHTVVSFGTQAITDMRGAVSGSVVSISNFPSTQTIAGTVTANGGDFTAVDTAPTKAVQIGFAEVNGSGDFVSVNNDTRPFPVKVWSGTVTANVSSVLDPDFTIANAIENGVNASKAGLVAQILSDTSSLYGVQIAVGNNDGNSYAVTTGNPLPISGTVTANGGDFVGIDGGVVNVEKSISLGFWDDNNLDFRQVKSLTDQLPVKLHTSDGVVGDGNSSIPVSGTVTASLIQGTSVTTSNFTSTTASTTLASANASRRGLTVFNEGAGNLHICAGATCTTIAYQVRLSAGDYYEVPLNQTSLTHSAVFATAGTARVTQIS